MDVNFCGLAKEGEEDICGVGLVVVFWGVGGVVVSRGEWAVQIFYKAHSSRGFVLVLVLVLWALVFVQYLGKEL